MDKELLKAVDVAKELGLYLKMVVSTKEYNNYNSFYNIYGEHEEPCRRILVLTSYKELEEVNEVPIKIFGHISIPSPFSLISFSICNFINCSCFI